MHNDSFVSVVVVAQSRLDEIQQRLQALSNLLSATYSDYEIVTIVSGLEFGNALAEDKILQDISGVRIIQLSTTVAYDVACSAGLENAIGDFVVLWNVNSDPVEIIPSLVGQCRSGQDIVIGVTEKPRKGIYRIIRKLMNVVLRTIDYNMPENSTSLRCLSRRAVNAVTRVGRFHHQIYLRIQKTGYVSGAFYYSPIKEIEGVSSSVAIRRLVRLMVFNSSRPLRLMSVIGFVGSVSGFLFALYSMAIHLFRGNVAEGWTTIVLFMSFMFVLLFIMLAFFGEYLGRLLDENSAQGEYAIVYERNSEIMINIDRVNVYQNSVLSSINKVQTGREN